MLNVMKEALQCKKVKDVIFIVINVLPSYVCCNRGIRRHLVMGGEETLGVEL